MLIINFMGGLGLLLFGMFVMAEGLQKIAGSKMKRLLEILTTNKFMGVVVGAFVTGIIHSSAAVTVMVVGFVNAGLMNLTQSVGVIMGANIGTTVTGWLISSVEWFDAINPVNLAPLAIGIGANFILFARKERTKQLGSISVGFGILFLGISMMTTACMPLTTSPIAKQAFISMGRNPLLGLLAGMVVTAVIHSSSAALGILQSLAMLNLVPWSSAVYIIMGQNIGTCVTALLSSIGTSKNAKTTAYIHLSFNLIGSGIFSVIAIIFFTYINPELSTHFINLTEISLVHTIFNIGTTVLLYPFSNQLIRFAKFLVRNIKDDDLDETVHLDERILGNTNFAIQGCLKEIVRMGNMACSNLKTAKEILFGDAIDKTEELIKREKQIDKLETAITSYLVKICNTNTNEKDNELVMSLFHVVNDIERIGDHSENIMEVAQFMQQEDLHFSSHASRELNEMFNMTIMCYKNAIDSLEGNNKMKAAQTIPMEENIDSLERELRESHIIRLSSKECNTKASFAFLDTITNLERVSDHALNIAQVVLEYKVKK